MDWFKRNFAGNPYLMVKTMVSCRFSLNPMTGIVGVWTSARNSKRKNLRSAGCIIGEMMNSTPLFPDASEIQVPSTGQRSTSGMVRLREKRLLPVCLFFALSFWTEKGNQLWVFFIIFGRVDATKLPARQVLRKIRNRCCVFNQDACDAVWDSTITPKISFTLVVGGSDLPWKNTEILLGAPKSWVGWIL